MASGGARNWPLDERAWTRASTGWWVRSSTMVARTVPMVWARVPRRGTAGAVLGAMAERKHGRTAVPESHAGLLDAPVGVLTTIGKDGFPQATAVWFIWDG